MRSSRSGPSVTLAIALAAQCVGCRGGTARANADDVPLGVPAVLAMGETRLVSGTEVQVTFVDVPENSLCPPMVQCAWAGRVVARFSLKRGTLDTTAALEWPGRPDAAVAYSGVALSLSRVQVTEAPPPGAPAGQRAPYLATVVVVRK